MGRLNALAPKIAKVAGVVSFPKREASFPALQAVIAAITVLWPKKTPAHVKHFIEKFLGSAHPGPSERTVRFWLAGETRMSVEALIALLRTDEGYAILVAVMGDCEVDWWLTTKNSYRLTRTRRQIAAAQKQLDEIKAGQAQIDLFQQ